MDFDFTTETITPDATNVLTIAGTGALELPVGTTLERPLSVIAGALRWNLTDGGFEYFNGTGWQAFGGSGTVTSVAASGGTTGMTFTGSPITTSGTLTLTGTLLPSNGGTGATASPTPGQLLIGNNSSTYTPALLTAGTGISIANGDASITISNTGVTSFTINQPASGITATNTGVSQTGAATTTLALSDDLLGLENLTTTGLSVRTGTSTWLTRSITGTTNQITVTNGSGVDGNPAIAISTNPIIPGSGSIQIPSGTTAERTSPASNGMIRYNTTTNGYEAWVIDRWVGIQLFTEGGTFQLNAYLGDIPSTTGTSTIPYDSTAPEITEGTQIWSRTVTPVYTTSRFVVECPFTVDLGTSNRVLIVSLFRGSVNLGTALFYSTGGGRPITLSMKVNDLPGTTSPITYSMRAGVGAGTATWYINATAGGQTLGGTLVSQYEIRELAS